jgi:uncharacterized protein YgiM (DUF1202 family)
MIKIIWPLLLLVLNGIGWVGIYKTANQLLNPRIKTEASVSEISVTIPTGTVIADALNMRDVPSANGKLIATLKKGDHLTIIGDLQDNWLPVEINGSRGFVSSSFVSIDEE